MTEKMTAAEFLGCKEKVKGEGRIKGAKRTSVGGIDFDSKREADRWGQLRFLEQGGEIRNLQRQVEIELIGRDGPILTATGKVMRYVCDFVYEDGRLNWAMVYEDAKGHPSETFLMKRAILAAQGIEVVIS